MTAIKPGQTNLIFSDDFIYYSEIGTEQIIFLFYPETLDYVMEVSLLIPTPSLQVLACWGS